MHARVSLHLVMRQGDLYSRACSFHRCISTGRHSCRGKRTTSTFPGDRNSGLRDESVPSDRQNVYRACARSSGSSAIRVAEAGPALSALQANILETEIQTAARVAKLVFDSGLARVQRPADMVAFMREHVYKPEYRAEAVPPTKAA